MKPKLIDTIKSLFKPRYLTMDVEAHINLFKLSHALDKADMKLTHVNGKYRIEEKL